VLVFFVIVMLGVVFLLCGLLFCVSNGFAEVDFIVGVICECVLRARSMWVCEVGVLYVLLYLRVFS